jgi:hypothetical protein
MRWLVEVTSVGKADTQQTFVVEAESWQRALQAARAQRGEEGPMSGFAIELLEDGYRAVDPVASVKFVVKRAPDDMPVTAPLVPKEGKGVAPSPPSVGPRKSTPPPKATKAKSIPPKAGAKSVPPPAPKSVPPRPNLGKNGAPLPVGSPIGGLPHVKVLSAREQDPTEASPLTYREYSFWVPMGTTEEVASDVLKAQLKLVDAHLEGAKMGKLVNLAAFDVEFTGKPPSPPLATLTWKDWKGEPIIGFPRRGAAPKQIKPPSSPPPSIPRPLSQPPPASAANVAVPKAAPVPSAVGATSTAAQPVAPPSTQPVVPAAAPVTQPGVSPAAPVSTRAPITQPGVGGPPIAAQPVMPVAVVQPVAAQPVATTGPSTDPMIPSARAPTSVRPPPPPATAQPASIPPPASVPPPAFPAPAQAPPEIVPTRSSAPPLVGEGMIRTPSGRFVRGRTTGDELITALFESMHDLHFLRDALDGGQFCLALATEVLPSRVAIIQFFDIEKREWVVACTRGKDASRLLTTRTPEGDTLLRDAARKRRALVWPDASSVATAHRYQSVGGCRSLIVAPIMQAGRALGALEIMNPIDGMPFNEDEANAMTYIAEQFAEYLGSRGIIVDSGRIQAGAAPAR